MSDVLLSGIQPTGDLHLGNYLGAISLWKECQGDYQSLFCIVDLHAITVSPSITHENIMNMAALYIACGIDPEKSSIFIQSSVPEHLELFWILGCITPIGWLNRMIQFKEKSGKNKENSSLGLYAYPVLMAADILVYRAKLVPVGNDQTQHIELTCDIAEKFNHTYNVEYFNKPQVNTSKDNKHLPRVMSLRDGGKKMSKSDTSDNARINLLDPPELIAKKIKSAKTDSIPGFDYDSLHTRPEANNLINVLSSITGEDVCKLCNEIENFTQLKSRLEEALIDALNPIQKKFKDIVIEKDYIEGILSTSTERARNIATKTVSEVKRIVGLNISKPNNIPTI